MARIRVDILNTKSHNEQLQKTTDSLINELTSKDKLIEKYEMEIRQRNDQIEKKMHTVDRLNRKYEALVAGEPEEENLGPLEGTHNHNNVRQNLLPLHKQTDSFFLLSVTFSLLHSYHQTHSKTNRTH